MRAVIQSALVGRRQLSLEMQFRSAHRHFIKAVIPFIPLTTDLKNGHEESVNLVALYKRLGRISLLLTNAG
jgi:hypothetical protein